MEEFDIGWALSAVAVSAVVGGLIGRLRGRVGSGVVWALALGPIGWLVVLLLKDLRQKCPECGGVIVPGARKCKNCGSTLAAAAEPAPAAPKISSAARAPAQNSTLAEYEQWKKAHGQK